MFSKAEQVLNALHVALEALAAPVQRNIGLPETIPPLGLVVLHDGEPGEPEVMLSPLTYFFTHRSELNLFVQAQDPTELFDLIKVGIGEILDLDRTLGGLCDWVEPQAPRQVDLPFVGGLPIKAASIIVELHYFTNNPLT